MKTYLRVLIYGFCLVVLPVIIVGGIYIADEGTRSVGFTGRESVYQVNKIQDDTVITIFDKKIIISDDLNKKANFIISYLDKNIPTLFKSASALVKTIFDQSHHL